MEFASLLDQPDTFGPMVGRNDVVRAIVQQFQSNTQGLPFYVAERERRTGKPARFLPLPPSPDSYRGGLDFETFTSDEFPLIIVVAQRDGAPERYGDTSYAQWFNVQVAAVIQHQTELEALDLADDYGICIAMCIAQAGGLGGLANKTLLSGYPLTEFVNEDRRTLVRSVTTFRVDVQPVLAERFGPWPPKQPGPPLDPYARPGQYPIVNEIDLTLQDMDGKSPDVTVVIDKG